MPKCQAMLGDPPASDIRHPSISWLVPAGLDQRPRGLRNKVGSRADEPSCRLRSAPPVSPDT